MPGHDNRYRGLALNVALFELGVYPIDSEQAWPLQVVPRIVAQREIGERSGAETTAT